MTNSYGPSIVRNGLVLCLDAADRLSYPRSDTTVYDLSGNGNNGTLQYNATYSSSNLGVISFDGSGDNLRVAESNSIKTASSGQFTKSGWFIRNGTPVENYGNVIWHKRTIIGVDAGGVLTASAYSIYSYVGATMLDSEVIAEDNKWYYACVTYNNTATKIYINGELKKTGTATLESEAGVTFDIGSGSGINNYWKGKLGPILSYNRALSAEEVQQNYEATKSRFGL